MRQESVETFPRPFAHEQMHSVPEGGASCFATGNQSGQLMLQRGGKQIRLRFPKLCQPPQCPLSPDRGHGAPLFERSAALPAGIEVK